MNIFKLFSAAAPAAVPSHPYYPPGAPLPHYEPNTAPLPIVLASFGVLVGGAVGAALLGGRRLNKSMSCRDQLQFCWFFLCGFLHVVFEGFFVLNHRTLAGSQHILAQAWKEYALSDSRYLTSDPFMVCIETITALVWGPLCLATAYYTARSRRGAARGLRHVLQTVVCIAHLYGVLLYYVTCHFDWARQGLSYSRPEFLYFWVYYAGLNAPWAVVPAVILFNSAKEIICVFQASDSVGETLQEVPPHQAASAGATTRAARKKA